MSAGLHTVHVRINDAATGQPVPVRARFTNPAGDTFAPLGRHLAFATGRNQDVGGHVRLGLKPYFYIDGACEIRLPAGPLQIELSRGLEYLPQRTELQLAPGQLSLRLGVERWANLRNQGWYSGETRAHFLTPHAALLEAQAEDLAVVNLLAMECKVRGPYHQDVVAVPNLLAFSGQRPALEVPGHLVAVNTHNCHPFLGSLGLLHCHRVVHPLSFGGPGGWDDWTLADWRDQCHRKGGLVVWTRTWHESADFLHGEPLADLILGKVDAFEIDFFEDSPFDVLPDWVRLQNCGLRVPLVGGSGKDSNDIVLGSMRTYARLEPGATLTYSAWIEAVRAGRTFVTNGPLLALTVNGREPGAVLELTDSGIVHVHAEARGALPLDRLEIVYNGAVVADAVAAGTPVSTAMLEVDLPISESGWLAARCGSSYQLFQRPANQRVFAHTSPVYMSVASQPMRADPAARARFLTDLERTLDWVQRGARCEHEQERERLARILRSAHEKLSGEPAA